MSALGYPISLSDLDIYFDMGVKIDEENNHESTDVDDPNSTSMFGKNNSALAPIAIVSIGGLASWNLVRMLTLTPEANGYFGNGPMPHDVLSFFMAMWAVVTGLWFAIFIILRCDHQKKKAGLAAVATSICIVVFLINGFLWYECIASI